MSDSKFKSLDGDKARDLDAEQVGTAGFEVFRQRMQIAGDALAKIAGVTNADPAGGSYGLVVRLVGTMPLPTGAATEATQLLVKADLDVIVSDKARANAGAPVGVAVGVVAVLVIAANASRKSIVISNTGITNVYIGISNTVTILGAVQGVKLIPNGTYSDSGDGMYTGDIYAIGDALAGSVSVWERT